MAKKPRSRDNVLSEDEIIKIKNNCIDGREKLVIYSLLFTGLRISEFIHMKKSWIKNGEFIKIPSKQKCSCFECKRELKRIVKHKEVDTGLVQVSNKISKPSGVWKPKTKNGIRVIFILPEAKSVLNEFFKKYNSIMDVVSNRITAWNIIKKVSKKAGIKHNVFPHCMRSTYATILAEKEFDAESITNLMGWKKIDMALSYIKHREEPLKKMFLKKFDIEEGV